MALASEEESELDVLWEGLCSSIIGGVLCEIQLNTHSKSRIVHIDQVVPIWGNFDGNWIHDLPRKCELLFSEDHLEVVKKPGICEESTQPLANLHAKSVVLESSVQAWYCKNDWPGLFVGRALDNYEHI